MDLSNKKMKWASVNFEQSHVIGDEAKEKLKYQTLLQEFLDLQKEYVSKKRKLQATKQKKEIMLAEVRFLRQRRKYLLQSQAPSTVNVHHHLPNSDIGSNTLQSGEYWSVSKASKGGIDQVLISNSHLKKEEEDGNGPVHEKDVRKTKKLKNHLPKAKGVGKKKICWPGQVTLKV